MHYADRVVTLKRACLWIVAAHSIVAMVHNQAHQKINVALSSAQNAFALSVIVIAPIIAAVFLWRGRDRIGATLLTTSLIGSLIFGVVNHFMLDSPDQLAHIESSSWGNIFVVSAYALAITELAGVFVGSALMRSTNRANLAN